MNSVKKIKSHLFIKFDPLITKNTYSLFYIKVHLVPHRRMVVEIR